MHVCVCVILLSTRPKTRTCVHTGNLATQSHRPGVLVVAGLIRSDRESLSSRQLPSASPHVTHISNNEK